MRFGFGGSFERWRVASFVDDSTAESCDTDGDPCRRDALGFCSFCYIICVTRQQQCPVISPADVSLQLEDLLSAYVIITFRVFRRLTEEGVTHDRLLLSTQTHAAEQAALNPPIMQRQGD
jgi:hypothetical protein